MGSELLWGNIEDFKLILKVVNETENYKREIWAYEVENLGVAVSFTGDVNETGFATSTFISGATIQETLDSEGNVTARKIVQKV